MKMRQAKKVQKRPFYCRWPTFWAARKRLDRMARRRGCRKSSAMELAESIRRAPSGSWASLEFDRQRGYE